MKNGCKSGRSSIKMKTTTMAAKVTKVKPMVALYQNIISTIRMESFVLFSQTTITLCHSTIVGLCNLIWIAHSNDHLY